MSHHIEGSVSAGWISLWMTRSRRLPNFVAKENFYNTSCDSCTQLPAGKGRENPSDKYFCFVVEAVDHSLQIGVRWTRTCASPHRAELAAGAVGIHGFLGNGMQERCSGSHCPSHRSVSPTTGAFCFPSMDCFPHEWTLQDQERIFTVISASWM